jgi:hypothetical protein
MISAAKGGANHISNRVPSCKRCNAVEKRERDWHEFLREKAADEPTHASRCQKIEA